MRPRFKQYRYLPYSVEKKDKNFQIDDGDKSDHIEQARVLHRNCAQDCGYVLG